MSTPAPDDPFRPIFAAAIQHHQAGRLADAERFYNQILVRNPQHSDALHGLGILAGQVRKHDLAIDLFRRAIALRPAHAGYHGSMAIVLRDMGRLDDAIAVYQHALTLDPNFTDGYNNLGNALRDKGRLPDAIACFQKALSLNPNHVEALNNLGISLTDQRRPGDAVAFFQRALSLRPSFASAYNNLGNALKDLGRTDEAIAAYQKALELQPNDATAHANLGLAYKDKGRMDESIASQQRAIELNPNFIQAHANLGGAYFGVGRLDEAMASRKRAMALKPDFAAVHSAMIYSLAYQPGVDQKKILAEARMFDRMQATEFAPAAPPQVSRGEKGRRLRIGYVSPDFRDHCQSFFTYPLLSNHDRSQFEIFCYASVPAPDAITAKLQTHVDNWRPVAGWLDEQVAQQIRQDRIDILVDLTMHMADNRARVFARKPAPIQVAWLAYPGTTGLSAMDYRLTDPHLDPEGVDANYAEKSIRLPNTFWCYDPLTTEPEVNSLPAEKNGHITFGCFNNFCKVNDGTLKIWARVMRGVSDSKLFILAPEGSSRQRVRDVLKSEGVEPDRVDFVSKSARRIYLAFYHRVDLCLDTLPYNGHTTSLDSYWMGVPVATLVGDTIVGRAGLSQLMNLRLPELIARSQDEYEAIVKSLAGDLSRLAELRRTLRERMRSSALMDGAHFARAIESAYRQMIGD